MMNYIFAAIAALSLLCAVFGGGISALSQAIISSGTDAVGLVIKLAGMICFWNGLAAIAEKSGLTDCVCRILSPAIRLLFPKIKDNRAKNAISMNITANLLGLGNAATPLGIEAMQRLKNLSPDGERATDDMIRFVVINSAALHLVPATVALMRQQHASAAPVEILLPSLVTSAAALSGGLILTAVFKRINRTGNGSRRKKKNGGKPWR